MLIKILKILIYALALISVSAYPQTYTTESPDKNLIMTIDTSDSLRYSISRKGVRIIDDSPLGFEFKGEKPMKSSFTVINKPGIKKCFEKWKPVVKNRHSEVSLDWNEQTIELLEKSGEGRRMDLTVRVFNDGVAFRYTIYGGSKPGDRKITKELTGFSLPSTSKAWMGLYRRNYTSPQESEFQERLISEMPSDTVVGLPMLVELSPESYIAITEAHIENYPGCYLGRGDKSPSTGRIMVTTRLSPLPGEGEDGVKAYFDEKTYTPWRVILAAEHPGRFIETDIIASLNPPCAITDTSWIKPGMSAWDHWWSGDVKMDMETIKEYIDLASEQKWPYMLIDWSWYGKHNSANADITIPAPQIDIKELVEYAGRRGVRCWLWLHNSDANRNDAYKDAFPLYREWGIAGVKIDFMSREDQEMVAWYRRIVKAAAENHLLVDFHASFKPDGIDRTYPNLLTREGLLGEEYSKFSDRIVPRHNVTIPFTRMIAGPMDYTPGGFLNVTPSQFRQQTPTLVMNTRCAELAKFVIYESPYTVFSDHPRNVLGQHGIEFLKNFPTVWDDTKCLGGYPGEYIIMARQAGDNWYIGAMTNESERDVIIDTSFLPEGSYTIQFWKDGKNAKQTPSSLTSSANKITSGDPLSIRMASGGGFVAIITPLD